MSKNNKKISFLISKNNNFMKAVENMQRLADKPQQDMIKFGKRMHDMWAEVAISITEVIKRDREAFREDYEKYLKNVQHYLNNEGIPIPPSVEDAFEKFIFEIIGDDYGRSLQQADIIKIGLLLKKEYDDMVLQADENKDKNINSETGSRLPADWDSIRNQMDELTSKGYSDSEASRIVEKEIKGVRKAGTIRNTYRGYV